MAFQIVKARSLPAHTRGRKRSSTAKLAITPSGRLVANTSLSQQWKDVESVLLRWDEANSKIAVLGLLHGDPLPKGLKESDTLPVSRDKKNGVVSIPAASFLDALTTYDYAKLGHKSYACAWHESFGYVVELPVSEQAAPDQEEEPLIVVHSPTPRTMTAGRGGR